jgi:alpha-N-arabinofuranosidase
MAMGNIMRLKFVTALALGAALLVQPALAQTAIPTITIKAGSAKAKVSPIHYGLMTEEINFSYEGGLYAELIRNRTFKSTTGTPDATWWSAVGGATFAPDPSTPFNAALGASLKLDATGATAASPAGLANGGFWGIPVKAHTTYRASFFAKAAPGFKGPVTLALQSADGQATYATATVSGIGGAWKQYHATLKTGEQTPTMNTRFVLTTATPGTLWLQEVSLFPPTYKGTKNGNRVDLMQILDGMNPQFLRFPGGNYLEGDTIAERFDWKKTIGPTWERPGHRSPWNYWSTDGMGMLEFLEWCEDLGMEPLLGVYAGYSLRQDRVAVGEPMKPYIQDALDQIEYVIGDAKTTTWGARRAKDGHPAPFKLRYVEIGNEDWFDRESTYDARFTQFYDAIKAKYPQLQLISSITPDQPAAKHVTSRTPDLVDQHLYPSSEGQMEARAHEFDTLPRPGPKIFVGEWATRVGSPTTNMAAALADAAYMTGMERNSDHVVMQAYAPLLTNVSNPLGNNTAASSMQWRSDLIGYDAMTSYGSPSYHAQAMFSNHHGDEILATEEANIPTWSWTPPVRTRNGVADPAQPARELPSLYYDVTRDAKSKIYYLKVVNRSAAPQPVHFVLQNAGAIRPDGVAIVLKGEGLDDTNTIGQPRKIAPVEEKVTGLSADFTRDFPAFSITVLELKGR